MKILEEFDWVDDYLNYLKLKENGLKKDAKLSIKLFIDKFYLQEKSVKRDFIDALYRLAYSSDKLGTYLPYNLSNDVIKKEVSEWIKDEPNNPTPIKWSWDISNLQKALEIDPLDQEALILLGNMIINGIGLNQHEIDSGFGYDGSPSEDLKLIYFFKPLLSNINDESKRLFIGSALADVERVAVKSL